MTTELNLSQKCEVHIAYYPGAEKLNPRLHDIILQKAQGYNRGAIMTGWNEGLFINEFKIISDYTLKIIENFYDYSGAWRLKLKDLWGQYYRKDDYQIEHHHLPHHWSFAYYVNSPKGSAPLVFSESNKKIFPKSGMIVLFPSWLRHHVPKHKCEEIRSIVSGNFVYMIDNWKQFDIIDQSDLVPIG